MSVIEPIVFRPRPDSSGTPGRSSLPPQRSSVVSIRQNPAQVAFSRQELGVILSVYGHKVASGEWRDYALDFTPDKAVFAIFQRTVGENSGCEGDIQKREHDEETRQQILVSARLVALGHRETISAITSQ